MGQVFAGVTRAGAASGRPYGRKIDRRRTLAMLPRFYFLPAAAVSSTAIVTGFKKVMRSRRRAPTSSIS